MCRWRHTGRLPSPTPAIGLPKFRPPGCYAVREPCCCRECTAYRRITIDDDTPQAQTGSARHGRFGRTAGERWVLALGRDIANFIRQWEVRIAVPGNSTTSLRAKAKPSTEFCHSRWPVSGTADSF